MRLTLRSIDTLRGVLAAREQGVSMSCTERSGLHPLVVPIFKSVEGSVTGVIPRKGPRGQPWTVVRTIPAKHASPSALVPLGSVRGLIHRYAAEAHAEGDDLQAALGPGVADAAQFDARDPILKRHGLDAYLVLRAGPFLDVWSRIIDKHVQKGDFTAAEVAAETCAEANAEWGCAMWLQSSLAVRLGHDDLARDLALAALLKPLDALCGDLGYARRLAMVPDGVAVTDFRRAVGSRSPEAKEEGSPRDEAGRQAADMLDDAVDQGLAWEEIDRARLVRLLQQSSHAQATVAAGMVTELRG